MLTKNAENRIIIIISVPSRNFKNLIKSLWNSVTLVFGSVFTNFSLILFFKAIILEASIVKKSFEKGYAQDFYIKFSF